MTNMLLKVAEYSKINFYESLTLLYTDDMLWKKLWKCSHPQCHLKNKIGINLVKEMKEPYYGKYKLFKKYLKKSKKGETTYACGWVELIL